MPRVICTLPNASLLINNIAFEVMDDRSGVISEEIDQATAERFASIPGYMIEGADGEDQGSTSDQGDEPEPEVKGEAQQELTPAQKAAATRAAKKAAEEAAKKAEEEAAESEVEVEEVSVAEDAQEADDAQIETDETLADDQPSAESETEIF